MKRTYVDIIGDYYDDLEDVRQTFHPHKVNHMDVQKFKHVLQLSKKRQFHHKG